MPGDALLHQEDSPTTEDIQLQYRALITRLQRETWMVEAVRLGFSVDEARRLAFWRWYARVRQEPGTRCQAPASWK